MNNLDKYFNIANKAVEKVSKYLLADFGEIKDFKVKGPSDIYIKQDVKANKMYEEYLKEETPEISLFTEEGEQVLSDGLVWVIDPIEGTSNYRAGIPFFATTICLLSEKSPMLSIVYAPALKQKFYATKGAGAFLDSRKIAPSLLKDLTKAMVSVGRGRKPEDKKWYAKTILSLMPKVRTIRTLGAAGLDMAYTAAGMLDVYLARGLEPGGGIYDVFPGLLLLEESGCEVVNEKEEKFSLGDSFLLASNKKLVSQVLKITAKNPDPGSG